MIKKSLKFIFSLSISIVIFIFLFQKIPYEKVFISIEKSNFKIILIVPLISILNGFFVSSLRWKLILNKMGCDISWKELFFVKTASDPIISVIPMKIGEISRVLYLKQIKNFSKSKTTISILLEYFLNICTVLFLIFLGLLLGLFQHGISFLNQLIFLSFCSLNIKDYLIDNTWFKKLKTYFKKCFNEKSVFFNKQVLCISFTYAILEILCVYLLSRAISINIPFYVMMINIPIVLLISSIPITFLGLGIREGLMVVLFKEFASTQKLFALGLLYSFSEHILPMMFGLCFTSLFINKIISRKKPPELSVIQHE